MDCEVEIEDGKLEKDERGGKALINKYELYSSTKSISIYGFPCFSYGLISAG